MRKVFLYNVLRSNQIKDTLDKKCSAKYLLYVVDAGGLLLIVAGKIAPKKNTILISREISSSNRKRFALANEKCQLSSKGWRTITW